MSLNSTDPVALALYYQTHPVPQTINPGIILASILVSALGAETTLLLLSRRTSTAGARNWGLLLLAAITMGSVGIWGMHFIGMNIVLRPAPGISWYIQFNPGFTVLSLFVPMLSLAFAFVFIGAGSDSLPVEDIDEEADPIKQEKFVPEKSCIVNMFQKNISLLRQRNCDRLPSLRIVFGGLIVGGTVSLMHYSAGFSASFEREYNLNHLAFSIILACAASILSLLVFFRFQAQWHENWWKKMICALGLAAGVSGMHYLGLTGTRWYVPLGKTEGFAQGKKSATVMTIAIGFMCFAVCVISVIIVLSDFLVTRESRRKARRVVIASVTFDKAGRVLVNLDGMIPMSEVDTDFPLKDIIEELNYRQSTFQWLYTLSWDWSILDPFLSRIAGRSLGLTPPLPSPLLNNGRFVRARREPGTSYLSSKNASQLALFKDRCLETTQSLAHSLGLSVHQMGVFFDNVLRTGSRVYSNQTQKPSRSISNDEESSVYAVPISQRTQQGVMLFLVRELSGQNQDTVDNYLKRGYRFMETRWFTRVLADRAAVAKSEIEGLLEQLQLYAKRGIKPCVRSGGVYVGFFAVRPSISRQGGIDTLVYQFARHQIPAYRVPEVESITDEIRLWVASRAGQKMSELRTLCANEVDRNFSSHSNNNTKEEIRVFRSSLLLAIDAMSANLKMFPRLAERSVLSAEIVEVPSSKDDSEEMASMIIFQATFPSPARYGVELPGLSIQNETIGGYAKQEPIPTFVFVPYTLFSKTQMMILRANLARKFARECRLELEKRYPRPAALSDTSKSANIAIRHQMKNGGSVSPNQVHWQEASLTEENGEKQFPVAVTRHGKINETPDQLQTNADRTQRNSTQGLGKRFRNSTTLDNASFQASPHSTNSTSGEKPSHPRQTPEYDGLPAPTYSSPSIASYGGPITPETPTHSHSCSPLEKSYFSPSNDLIMGGAVTPRILFADNAKAHLQPMALTARLRSDDWPSRCLHSLEQGETGEVLLGVDW
ncbi:hypothetical protein O181_017098 [Austropuccinia psidii MF-1]|uniref:MHYT domain-containing protein n=1 Tax=Austropuccinia psidii MF-1 TaxID=1389203 RepID=A0A9Q3GRH6_9BASI|nr:hypothetical protein [Austropuccinia psidii MF-1]